MKRRKWGVNGRGRGWKEFRVAIQRFAMSTPESVFQTDARRRTTMPKVIPPNETFTDTQQRPFQEI
jgi:hypothetical protein